MKKDPEIFLIHILGSIADIERYTRHLVKESFSHDTKTQDAVLRKIGIIGEAVRNLSSDFRKQYPNASWKNATGMRDVLIHDYFDIDTDIVWATIKEDLPKFKNQIATILTELRK